MKKIFTLMFVALIAFGCSESNSGGPEGPAQVSFAVRGERYPLFAFGESRDFAIVHNNTISDLDITVPNGWVVTNNNEKITVTAPAEGTADAEFKGSIVMVATGETGSVKDSINVLAGDFDILTFENADPTELASDQYGANLYADYQGDYPFVMFSDVNDNTTLTMGINEADGAYNFWSGGIVLSKFNDMGLNSYLNQCSVYYKDPATGKGGNRGSNNFAVHNGYDATVSTMFFLEDDDARVIDHFYVNNSTYAVLTMEQGGGVARALSYANQDWLKLTATGFDASGSQTGTVDFYLADFRTPSSKGIVKEWTRVDLSSLGAVHKVEFSITGTDIGDWGLNTPGYFCFDDVAVEKAVN